MSLMDVVPVDATGARGLCSILEEENVAAWTAANAERLLGEGYVRINITPHVATTMVGDRLDGRTR